MPAIKLYDLFICNYKNGLVFLGVNGCQAGEAAECRQHRIGFSKIKAGKPQRLASEARNANARMNMTAEKILSFRWFAGFGIVCKNECPLVETIVHHGNIRLFVPGFFQNIVISFDKSNVKRFKIGPPFQEEVKFFIGAAVEKVAHNNQFVRFKILQQVHEALHIFLVNRLRHGYAGFSEVAGLAKVKV